MSKMSVATWAYYSTMCSSTYLKSGRWLSIICRKFMFDRFRMKINLLHMRYELIRYFFEDLLCKIAALNSLVILNKLYYITQWSIAKVISQDTIIAVELNHRIEVCISHSDYYYWYSILRKLDYKRAGHSHIVYCAISQNHQNVILIDVLLMFHIIKKSCQKRSE